MDVGPLVIPHAQAAKLTEPGKCALHDPPPPAQGTPVRGATHGQQWHDVTSPETAPNSGRVVAAIPEHTGRPLPRSPAFTMQRGNRIHQRQSSLRVVPVRAGQAHGERYAAPVANQMALAPALGPIGGIRTGLVTAVHRADATTVHDRARPINWSSRASQSSSAKWIRSNTPACCQSCSRRQHVIPDPHPSSRGSICHGIPLRRTKTIPVRHARFETRGRPPFGRRGGIGKNGSTRSHNGSGSSATAMAVHATSPTRIKFRRFCYTLLGQSQPSSTECTESRGAGIAPSTTANDRTVQISFCPRFRAFQLSADKFCSFRVLLPFRGSI